MFCQNCGAVINDTARFCENCGAAVVTAAAPVTPVYTPVEPDAQPEKTVVEEQPEKAVWGIMGRFGLIVSLVAAFLVLVEGFFAVMVAKSSDGAAFFVGVTFCFEIALIVAGIGIALSGVGCKSVKHKGRGKAGLAVGIVAAVLSIAVFCMALAFLI